jgi:hypothetical protein
MPPDQPQGTPSHTEQDKGGEPKFVTEEQLNRAITSRFKDFEKKLDKSNEGLVTTLSSKLEELVTGKLESLQPKPDDKGEGSKPAGESPEMKAMARQLAEVQKALEKSNQEKDVERARSRDRDLRSKLQEALSGAGITGVQLKHAVGVLVDAEKRVRIDDDDRVLFKGDDGDELPLADGVKSWVKTDEAKIYLPPRGSQGSGDRSQGKGTPNGQQQPSVGSVLLNMASSVMTEKPNG